MSPPLMHTEGRNVPPLIDLTWMESLREGLSSPFLAITCFGLSYKKPAVTCLEGRLVPVRIQQIFILCLK